MTIVAAQLTDIELLIAFAEHTFRVAYQADNEPVAFENYCREAFSTAQFQREMRHPHASFWLCWHEEKLAGYLKLNLDNHPAEVGSDNTLQVERIYVEPTLQGRGLGAEMLEFCFEQAQKAQADWIWLSVWQKNPRAIKFYERCGYEICGTEIFVLDNDPQVDWIMRKKIAP